MAGGRPTKFDPSIVEAARELALEGKTNDEMAAALNINRSTLTAWSLKHPEFSAALKCWKGEADDAVELSLYRKALAGDVTACIFWLKNRRSEAWRDVKHIDAKQETTHRYDLDSLPDERLDELERILADARPSQSSEVPAQPSRVH